MSMECANEFNIYTDEKSFIFIKFPTWNRNIGIEFTFIRCTFSTIQNLHLVYAKNTKYSVRQIFI